MTNHKTISLMFGLAVLLCSSQSLTGTDEKQQIAPKVTFLVIYRPGPAWLVGKSVSEQPLKEHGKYMLGLYVKGSMNLAGPLTDNAGGAVVLEVADEAHPWELKPWDEYAKKVKNSTQSVTPVDAKALPHD
jgi:uncharacterized protein YciI